MRKRLGSARAVGIFLVNYIQTFDKKKNDLKVHTLVVKMFGLG